MASESRLYTFSPSTQEKLRKFRLSTSNAPGPRAIIYQINKQTLEIAPVDDVEYTSIDELAEELPEHSARFVLLSYPLTLPSGRLSVPYVLLYYLPISCNAEMRVLYAGAKELMRAAAETGRVVEMEAPEEVLDVETKLLQL
ncbi:MAG: hypothetical protein M1829_004864 [Trizodia sp. TS-e1964]|nr:MAG: hypothetical protein M1829_004864 [Trizodia sp. TS-e1964]